MAVAAHRSEVLAAEPLDGEGLERPGQTRAEHLRAQMCEQNCLDIVVPRCFAFVGPDLHSKRTSPSETSSAMPCPLTPSPYPATH